jgi:hypothetical protein
LNHQRIGNGIEGVTFATFQSKLTF